MACLPCHTSGVEEAANAKESSTKIEVKTRWAPVQDVVVHPINQFAATLGIPSKRGVPEGIYLTLGHLQMPILLGGEEELEAIRTNGLTVAILGRFALTRSRLDELMEVLKKAADQYDDAVGREEKEEDD